MQPSKNENWYYDLLKELAEPTQEDKNEDKLEVLKNMFKKDIDSTRRVDSIKSVADLIDTLERRDVLSEHNVDALFSVAECCGNHRLHRALLSYPMPKVAAAEINQYQQQRLAEELKLRPLNVTCAGQMQVPHRNQLKAFQMPLMMTDSKRKAMNKLLSQQIGKYWRRLGRELDLNDAIMDQIETQYPNDLSSRIIRILQIFEERECYDSKDHAMLICSALEKCQRKDLIRSINAIFSAPNREE